MALECLKVYNTLEDYKGMLFPLFKSAYSAKPRGKPEGYRSGKLGGSGKPAKLACLRMHHSHI
jgi:hypothetical protein